MRSPLLHQARERLQGVFPICAAGCRLDLKELTEDERGIHAELWKGYCANDDLVPTPEAKRRSFLHAEESRELVLPAGYDEGITLAFLDAWTAWLCEMFSTWLVTAGPRDLGRPDALHRLARSNGQLEPAAALRVKPARQLETLAALGFRPRVPATAAQLAKRCFAQVADWAFYPYLRVMVALGEKTMSEASAEPVSNDLWCLDLAAIEWSGAYAHLVHRMAALARVDVERVESEYDRASSTARLRFRCKSGACDLTPRVDDRWVDLGVLRAIATKLEASRPGGDPARFAVMSNTSLGQACLFACVTEVTRESLFDSTGLRFSWLSESPVLEEALARGVKLPAGQPGSPGHTAWLTSKRSK